MQHLGATRLVASSIGGRGVAHIAVSVRRGCKAAGRSAASTSTIVTTALLRALALVDTARSTVRDIRRATFRGLGYGADGLAFLLALNDRRVVPVFRTGPFRHRQTDATRTNTPGRSLPHLAYQRYTAACRAG